MGCFLLLLALLTVFKRNSHLFQCFCMSPDMKRLPNTSDRTVQGSRRLHRIHLPIVSSKLKSAFIHVLIIIMWIPNMGAFHKCLKCVHNIHIGTRSMSSGRISHIHDPRCNRRFEARSCQVVAAMLHSPVLIVSFHPRMLCIKSE